MRRKSRVYSSRYRIVVARSRDLRCSDALRSQRLKPLFAALLSVWAGHALALPTGAQPVAGNVSVATPDARTLNVTQTSDKAIVNWTTFSVGAGEAVNIAQPAVSSVILNRVIGGSYSEILGRITANGQVFLVNPLGITLGTGAQVDAAGFLASTLSISDQDFLAGRFAFSNSGGAGAVVNKGSITASSLAALLGPQVRNEGTISARMGTVGLAAGDRVSLDFRGDGLVKFSVDAAAIDASIANHGAIIAEGGNIVMTAQSANALLDTVINMDGVARATTLAQRNGTIVLDGGSSGVVAVSGVLDASGRMAGQSGGTVHVLGDKVGLFDAARVDATGDQGGGTVLVGGNFQGNGPQRNASGAFVGANAAISADAGSAGDGGRVIVWSDKSTQFYGAISARGGSSTGNGGFAEVSGKANLDYRGFADLRAAHGTTGTLLLDPKNLTVANAGADPVPTGFNDPGASTNVSISPADLVTALSGAAVTLFANNDVTFSNDVTSASANNLTVQAGRSISLGNNFDLSLGGAFSATFNHSGATSAQRDPGAATFSMSATNATITAAGGVTITGGTLAADSSGATSIAANTGNVTLEAITTTPAAAGANAGIISVSNNAAAGKNITANSLLDSRGAAAGAGAAGTGGNITLNASGALSVGQLNSSGGANANAGLNGGAAGAVALTGGTGVTLNDNITASGGTPGAGGTQGAAGTVTLVSPTTLAGAVAVNTVGSSGGNIAFNSTLDGGQTLALTTAGTVTFSGAVGASTRLTSLAVNGGGTVAVQTNASSIETNNNQTYTGPVTLSRDASFQSGAGALAFNSTIAAGANALVFAANTIAFNGGANSVTGTGTVVLRPTADNVNIGLVTGGVGGLQVSQATLDALQAGFSMVTIGRAAGTGTTTVGSGVLNPSFGNPVTVLQGGGGTITVNGAVTGSSSVALDAAAGGTVNLNNNITSTNQPISITGATDLSGAAAASVTLSAGTGGVTLNQSVDGGKDLIVNSTGATTFGGAVGGATSLTSLTTNPGGTTAINGGTVRTTAAQTYNDAVTLGAAATLASTGNAAISLNSTVNGAQTLTVNTTGTTSFGGVVGGTTPLASLTTNAGGTTAINTTAVTTAQTQSYGDAVTLGANTTLTSNGAGAQGNITFGGTVNGAQTLAINTAGTTTFNGVVGGTTPLTSITTDVGGTTVANIAGAPGVTSIKTTGNQTYNDNFSLSQDTKLDATPGGVVSFNGTVTTNGHFLLVADSTGCDGVAGTVNGAQAFGNCVNLFADFTVNAATGNVSFAQQVNGAHALVISNAGTTTFTGAVGGTTPLTSIAVTGTTTAINGGAITTTGAQTYNSGVTIGGPTVLASTAAGNIAINGSLNGAQPLSINTAGTTTFGGVVGGTTPLTSITTDAAGTTAINTTAIATAQTQSYGDAVTLGANTTLTSNGAGAQGNISFGGIVNGAQTLAVNTAGTTTFGAVVGGTTPLTSITTDAAGATALNTTAITTAQTQSYGDPVTLGANTTLTSNGAGAQGNILFSGTIDGAQTLTLDTAGTTTFVAAVGGTTPLTSVATNIGGTTAINGGTVTTTATQTYGDSVTLGAGTTLASTGNAAITLNGTVNGAQTLAVNTTGATTFGAVVGGATPLTSITTDAGGTTSLGGNVTTVLDQTYNDAVTLAANATLASTGAGNIVFASTLNGGQTLTVNTAGTTIFGGVVGGTTPLTSITTNPGGTTVINTTAITTAQTQSYGDSVALGTNATFTSNGAGAQGDVTFSGTIDGAQTLTVNSAGTTTFSGVVGGTTPLTSVTTNAGGTTVANIAGAPGVTSIKTTGNQTYNDNFSLSQDTKLDATPGGIVAFNGTLTLNGHSLLATDSTGCDGVAGTVAGAQAFGNCVNLFADFTVNAATGNVSFAQQVNGAHALVISNAGTTTFTGAVGGTTPLTSIAVTGTTTAINGGAITTTGAQTYNSAVIIAAPTVFASTAAGNITFNGTIDGAQPLDINTSGTTTFAGAVGGTTPLASITTNAGGTTVINTGTISSSGNQTYNDAVTLAANTTLSAGAGNVAFNSTVNGAQTLAVNTSGTTSFSAPVGGTTALTALATDAGGTTAINGGAITAAAQSYGDLISLGADTVLSGTSGAFGAGITGNGFNLTLNFSGLTALTGASISGLANLATSGGGTTDLNGAISTSGAQTYNDAVTLSGPTVLTAGGNVAFASTVNGTNTLTVNSPAATTFGGVVGGSAPLASLTTDAGGTTSINAVTTSGPQTYADAVTLAGPTTLTSAGNAISFATLTAPGLLTITGASSVSVTQANGNLSVLLATGGSASLNATGNLVLTGGANQSLTLGDLAAGGSLNVTASGTGSLTQLAGTTIQSAGDLRLRAPNGDITVGDVTSGTKIELNNTGPAPGLAGEGRTLMQLAGTQLSAPFVRLLAGFNGLSPNNFAMGTREAPMTFASTVQQVDYAAPSNALLFFSGPARLRDDKKIFIITPPGGPTGFDFNNSSALGSQASNVAGEVVGGITSQITAQVDASFRPGRIDQVIQFGFQGDLSLAPPPVLGAIRGILLPPASTSDLEDPERKRR